MARHLRCEKHTMLEEQQKKYQSNIDLISFLIVVIIQQLFPNQIINEANCIFEDIQDKLPKKICYLFVIYKFLEKIIPNGPQLMILKYIETKIPATTYLEHEQRWNYAFRNSKTIP